MKDLEIVAITRVPSQKGQLRPPLSNTSHNPPSQKKLTKLVSSVAFTPIGLKKEKAFTSVKK